MRYLLLLALLPTTLSAQVPGHRSLLNFPTRTEVTLQAPVSSDAVAFPPGLRVTRQRRLGYRWSWTASGLLLSNATGRAGGVTAGVMAGFPLGGMLVEPFVAAGPGWADARLETGRYTAVGSDGVVHTVTRYRELPGAVGMGGAGVSGSAPVAEGYAVRVSLGYWGIASRAGRTGGLQLGIGIGRARRDAAWVARQLDRTPPEIVLLGKRLPEQDALELIQGKLEVLAADASGIASVRVNGERAALAPADPAALARAGLEEPGVSAAVELAFWRLNGPVRVTVRDRGGQERTVLARVLPALDRTEPEVRWLTPEDAAGAEANVRAIARDPAGIAGAWLNGCPLTITTPTPEVREVLDLTPEDRILSGTVYPAGGARSLVVEDVAGNRTTTGQPATAPPRPGSTTVLPELGHLEAIAYTRASDGARSVRVRGRARDAASVGIGRVAVNGLSAVLGIERNGSAAFDGWLVVSPGSDSVRVTAITLDGRRAEWTVGVVDRPAPEPASLGALVVVADSAALDVAALEKLGEVVTAGRSVVLAGPTVSPADVRAGLGRVRGRLAPGDALLVYLAGPLVPDPAAPDRPALLLAGEPMPLGTLASVFGDVGDHPLLVSTRLEPGRPWGARVASAPGAPVPPGCRSPGESQGTGFIDLRGATLDRIAAALAWRSPSGDRPLTLLNFLAMLSAEPLHGLLPFDPALSLRVRGGGR